MRADLPGAMAALTSGVTRVRVLDCGVSEGRALGDSVLCELTGEAAAELVARLAVRQPADGFHCMCLGRPAIELWAGERLRATVGVHHGLSARVDGWWSDAPLCDGEGLMRCLAEHGVAAPLAELLAARAAREEGELRRERWLAATPRALRGRLAALEGQMVSRSLRPTDAGAQAAVEAVRAELGGGTAAALLGWYGGPGGPWSGYPGYEAVAEVLLRCVAIEELIAAGETSEEAVLLGLARFLARHDAPPRERRMIDEGLRARLAALPIRADPDMWGRLSPVLERTRAPTCDAIRIADAGYATTFAHPVACAGAWAAIDGDFVVRFDRGRRGGTVCAALPLESSAGLAAADGELVVTLSREGEVWRVPLGGGEARVIARGQARPVAPAGFEGQAAWLEQEALPRHRTRTRVRLEGLLFPVAEHADNAWDLLACDGALWWGRHGGSLWSTLFGRRIHRVDLMRWQPQRGRARVFAVLEGGDDGTSVPRLFSDGCKIAWTSGRRIGVMDPRTRERRWFEVDASILAVQPRGDGVLVALARDHVGELVAMDGARSAVVARWQRALWERERLVVSGDRAVWNAGEHLWAVELGPRG